MTTCDRCGARSFVVAPVADGGVKHYCADCLVADFETARGGGAATNELPAWMERKHGGDPIGTGLSAQTLSRPPTKIAGYDLRQ